MVLRVRPSSRSWFSLVITTGKDMWNKRFSVVLFSLATLCVSLAEAELSCEIEERKTHNFRPRGIVITHHCLLTNDTSIIDPETTFTNPKNDLVEYFEFRGAKNIEYLPININDSFPNLKVLKGDQSSIKSISQRNFHDLSNLTHISLNKNNLKSLDEGTFHGLEELSHVYLDGNQISSVHPKIFWPLPNLDTIYLNDNQLDVISADLFRQNKNLALMHISNNKVKSIEPGSFDSLSLTRQIWLTNNEIASLPENLFDHCAELIDVDLSGNKITVIPPALFLKVADLHDVAFARNPLTVLDFAIFDHTPSLSVAYFNGIGDLKIKNIERVDQMKDLRSIILDDNNCINATYHEGLLEKLKQDVNANCIEAA